MHHGHPDMFVSNAWDILTNVIGIEMDIIGVLAAIALPLVLGYFGRLLYLDMRPKRKGLKNSRSRLC